MCVRNDKTTERFCGRDCLKDGGCPDDYLCFSAPAFEGKSQCIPVASSCTDHPEAEPFAASLAAMQQYSLRLLNQDRYTLGYPPVELDNCLTRIAQASAVELVLTGRAHGKFQRECQPVYGNCACGWFHENQLILRTTGNWQQEFEEAFTVDRIDDPEEGATLVGIGVVFRGSAYYVSVAFGS